MGLGDVAHFFVQSWHDATNISFDELFSLRGAFVPSVGTIVVSELGDKTFFIAALMSMKYNPFSVFMGAAGALYVMTILSALLGGSTLLLVDKRVTKYISIALFFYFGITQTYAAYMMDESKENEELAEVESILGIKMLNNAPVEIEARTLEKGNFRSTAGGDEEESKSVYIPSLSSVMDRVRGILFNCMNPVIWKAFTWTFVAEWGDRSQITTIALATANNWILVSLGAIIGHSLCTCLACFAGKMVSNSVSERIVGLIAGGLFLVFGCIDLFIDEY
eukprot:GHVH01006143.1.p1 GENE.GHVH01006143.1~~GHVH01006143.1.p1  ORF type:complete len:278 (-),score=41.38 GHVH01006143.1:50-883(-)